jgi:hypothetical protein
MTGLLRKCDIRSLQNYYKKVIEKVPGFLNKKVQLKWEDSYVKVTSDSGFKLQIQSKCNPSGLWTSRTVVSFKNLDERLIDGNWWNSYSKWSNRAERWRSYVRADRGSSVPYFLIKLRRCYLCPTRYMKECWHSSLLAANCCFIETRH